MKKLLLLSGAALVSFATLAQNNRYTLVEEFSGENCGPCASLNPGFWTKISAPGNETKTLLLKYQSPIPSAGPIYNENTIFTDARMDYYSVNSAPSAWINGAILPHATQPGNIAHFTQAMIDEGYSNLTPFLISIGTPTYTADNQSFSLNITVTASSATSAANVVLRTAFAEHLEFATAPGTNGEKVFHNVVRQMYPSHSGLDIDDTWTAGQSRTYTVTGAIPSYVKPTSLHKFFAAWLQNETTKEILQAARTADISISKPNFDAALNTVSTGQTIYCGVPATIADHTVRLKNTGASTMTSAKIFYKVGADASWTEYSWSGSLAAGAETTVSLPTITISTPGNFVIYDSVALPNAKVDLNEYDNVAGKQVYVLSESTLPMPYTNDLESTTHGIISYANAGGYPFFRYTGDGFGYDGSDGFLYYPLYGLGSGVNGYAILPKVTMPAGDKTMEFQVSYAQRTTQNDRLEVVYSTDCGVTWTSLWTKSGSALATVAPNNSTQYLPDNNTQWVLHQANLATVPNGALIAFKATSGNGNGLFVDNINIRTGAPTSLENIIENAAFAMYPNPATNQLNVAFKALSNFKATVQIVNVNGQTVHTQDFVTTAGENILNVNMNNLAAGTYMVSVLTENGSFTRKITKQ